MTEATTILSMWVVYRNPSDFPDKYVVRRWEVGPGWTRPTEDVDAWDSIEDARLWSVPADTVRLERNPNDDPTIAEVWI